MITLSLSSLPFFTISSTSLIISLSLFPTRSFSHICLSPSIFDLLTPSLSLSLSPSFQSLLYLLLSLSHSLSHSLFISLSHLCLFPFFSQSLIISLSLYVLPVTQHPWCRCPLHLPRRLPPPRVNTSMSKQSSPARSSVTRGQNTLNLCSHLTKTFSVGLLVLLMS